MWCRNLAFRWHAQLEASQLSTIVKMDPAFGKPASVCLAHRQIVAFKPTCCTQSVLLHSFLNICKTFQKRSLLRQKSNMYLRCHEVPMHICHSVKLWWAYLPYSLGRHSQINVPDANHPRQQRLKICRETKEGLRHTHNTHRYSRKTATLKGVQWLRRQTTFQWVLKQRQAEDSSAACMTESCPPSSPHPPGSDAPGCGGSDRSSAAAATRRPPLGPTAGEETGVWGEGSRDSRC